MCTTFSLRLSIHVRRCRAGTPFGSSIHRWHRRNDEAVRLARPRLRLLRARAALLGPGSRAPPRQAPQGLRRRRQHDAREARGARAADDLSAIVGLEKTLAFNLSGHVLHTLFWKNLSPDGGDRPTGELAAAIDEHFGSFDAFHKQLSKSAASVQGSGWGALTWEPLGERLFIEQIYDHQGNVGRAACPSSSSTRGSTRTTCSTRIGAPTTSRRSGTSSTGPMSPRGSNAHAASRLPSRRCPGTHASPKGRQAGERAGRLNEPFWARVIVLASVLAMAAFGAVGLLLADLGLFEPVLWFGLGLVAFIGLGWLARPLAHAEGRASASFQRRRRRRTR